MTQAAPTLTIVIPAYNVETYIVAALDSILRQTVLPDEVIVVNDGSTDRTPDLLARYANHPGFRLVTTENNGLGPARNLGRMLASSEYVYFFDADDLLRNTFVASIKKMITESDHPDLILFGGKGFSDKGHYYQLLLEDRHFVTGCFRRNDRLLTRLSENNELFCSACLYVSKKAVWAKNRLNFPPVIHEDEVIITPLIAVSRLTLVTSEFFFLRRVRPGSITTSEIHSGKAGGLLRFMHDTQEFMQQNQSLVQADLAAWRFRLGLLTIHYLKLCRVSETPVAWLPVCSALLASRRLWFIILFPITILRFMAKNKPMVYKHKKE